MLAMVLNPEVFYKARAELDRVVGTDRLPDFPDRPSLPYLECVIREVFRYVHQSLSPQYALIALIALQMEFTSTPW